MSTLAPTPTPTPTPIPIPTLPLTALADTTYIILARCPTNGVLPPLLYASDDLCESLRYLRRKCGVRARLYRRDGVLLAFKKEMRWR